MKKVVTMLLATILVVALGACALFHRHTWKDATCTEPKTCTVCGATEGEALGHAWVDATCTEPKTCTVCGATEGEALGHTWTEATFFDPKACQVCGTTEGEPLGSQLFINALNPEESVERQETLFGAPTGDEEAFVPSLKEIRITGSASGIDPEDEAILNDSSLFLIIDREKKDVARMGIEAIFKGSKPVNALLTVDETGLGFTLPGIIEEYYKVDIETLGELLGDHNASFSTMFSSQLAAGSLDKELQLKYEKIFFDVANEQNTTETVGAYALTGLNKTQTCRIIACSPSADDWQKMLETLFTTIQSDTELMDRFISQLVGQTYSDDMQSSFGSREEYENNMRDMIQEYIATALKNVPSIAKILANTTWEVAYDGARVYGIKITLQPGMAIAYESYGEAQTGRTDALFLHQNGNPMLLAQNELERGSEGAKGRFSIPLGNIEATYTFGKTEHGKPVCDILLSIDDAAVKIVLEEKDDGSALTASYDASGSAASIQAMITEGNEKVAVPEGPAILLKTEEEIQAARDRIAEGLKKAELYGHVWAEATCTEPKTCTICGETEGEALGHTWAEATCTEPKTCTVCGVTEGEPLGHDAVWETIQTDSIAATRTRKLVCTVCGEELETKTEQLDTFVEGQAFTFTPEEFVVRLQNAWNEQRQDGIILTFKYAVNSKGWVNFDIFNRNDAWLGWGLFYGIDGKAIEATSADAQVGSVRIFAGPVDNFETETLYYLFEQLIGPCSSAADPTIKDGELYVSPISENLYSVSAKKALNGLYYSCGYDKESQYFMLDIDIAQSE